ncbi:MAG: tRNA pseudouridine(55) synthase TruB [Oscillospiraceae bacterium]|nr:tRNA pseudouridine(55) synthase TruB [Oscillospiraceae bacterium]
MNGILLIDKEQDWTSNDVVVKLKGILHERRIGHSGTLDPMATGLLVVFVGRATRAVSFAESDEKRYLATLRLGLTTDTQDTTGNVIERRAVDVSDEALQRMLGRFTGEQRQIPPMYSAIKVHGKKLYEIARKGGELEREPRRIVIHELRLLGREGDDVFLDVRCSKGTYIRTLCHDIGAALGCGGCMAALRRISAGCFSVEDAVGIRGVQALAENGSIEERLLPVDSLFQSYPACTADAEQERRIRFGGDYACTEPEGCFRVYSESGEFLMLGRVENGQMHTIKSFFEV